MSNVLVDISNENENAYCVSPETVHEAIRRGVSKEEICVALVGIMAGTKEVLENGNFYLEDRGCCAFTALHEEYYQEAEQEREEQEQE